MYTQFLNIASPVVANAITYAPMTIAASAYAGYAYAKHYWYNGTFYKYNLNPQFLNIVEGQVATFRFNGDQAQYVDQLAREFPQYPKEILEIVTNKIVELEDDFNFNYINNSIYVPDDLKYLAGGAVIADSLNYITDIYQTVKSYTYEYFQYYKKNMADYFAKFISDLIDDNSRREFAAKIYTVFKAILLEFKSDWLQETSSKLLGSYDTVRNDLGKEMQQDLAEYEMKLKDEAAKAIFSNATTTAPESEDIEQYCAADTFEEFSISEMTCPVEQIAP
jgi:hypothetical protein